MREESLRWGGVMGLAGAVLGVLALVVGRIIAPVHAYTTAESAVFSIFVQGMIVLVLLGVVLGLAYYAGLRAERDRQLFDAPATPTAAVDNTDGGSGAGRLGSALAGALVMLCYWFATTMFSYLAPLNRVQRPGPVLETLEGHIILLLIFLVLGAALGALGGRAPAARNLLDRLLVPPPVAPLPATSAPAAPTQPSVAEPPTD